jgi:type VI secretion system secreted protein VgrG
MPNLSDTLAGLLGTVHGVHFRFATAAEKQPAWRVREFALSEGISTPYLLNLELITDERAENPAAMLGKNATLEWVREGGRCVHGIVESVRDGASTSELTVVHLTIVPALSALAHRTCSQIFSKLKIPDLVEQVLKKSLAVFGREVALELDKPDEYGEREYVVQHRETDLDFVSRLMADQGLWYYFKHEGKDGAVEKLVITNSPLKAPPIAKDPKVERTEGDGSIDEAIKSFSALHAMQTTGVLLRQYNWTNPAVFEGASDKFVDPAKIEIERYEHGDVAGYDYQEPAYRKHEVLTQARWRRERHQSERFTIHGKSDATMIRPGHFVSVDGHEYLLTQVQHTGGTHANTGLGTPQGHYENSFECLPRNTPYRPLRLEKQRILGVQTATVVDLSGKLEAPRSSGDGPDIATDVHGRIRVKFHWDLTEAGQGGTNSCWTRVAQAWAGQGWGAQFIPRVGMEVLVQFIDGDPDQPLVTGCVYNGLNPPPYAEKPTQSGIKTASSVDPTRYNELRFEDAKENEQIFVRAQKDYVEEVLNNHNTTVTGAQSNTVKKSQSESVSGNQSLSVGGKRTKTVGGDKENGEENTIKGTRTTTVTKAETQTFNETRDITVTGADTLTAKDHVKQTIGKGREVTISEQDDNTTVSAGHKTTNVKQKYTIWSEQQFAVAQGGGKETQLAMDGKIYAKTQGDITLTTGDAKVSAKGGKLQIEGKEEIKLVCGQASITLKKDGTLEIAGMKVQVGNQTNNIKFEPAGATLSGVKVSASATAMVEVAGPLIKIG